MIIKNRMRADIRTVVLAMPPVWCENDLLAPRECVLRLSYYNHGTRPFDKTPHFSIKHDNGGMAFPELLRAYSQLFSEAADFVEGKEPPAPLDYQI